MSRVPGRIVIRPIGSGKPSEVLNAWWLDSPKSERTKEAVKVVTKRFRPMYQGQAFVVEAGNLTEKGEDGRGRINLNGVMIADFAVVATPPPVPLGSLLDGGLR